MSRVVGQNSLTPWGEQNPLTPQGNNNLNFRLTRDHLQTAVNLLCQLRQGKNFWQVSFLYWVKKYNKTVFVSPRPSFQGLGERKITVCLLYLFVNVFSGRPLQIPAILVRQPSEDYDHEGSGDEVLEYVIWFQHSNSNSPSYIVGWKNCIVVTFTWLAVT